MKILAIKSKLLWLCSAPLLFIVFALITALYMLLNLYTGRIENLGNYQIFVNSFTHLINYKNLYMTFNDGLDLYKYSPTFALFMGLFSWMPNYIGLLFWHVFNLLILYVAVKNIETNYNKIIFYCFILITSWGSFQSSQINAMMGGLIYLFGICIYEQKLKLAAFLLAILGFIKIYGCFAIILLIIVKDNKMKFLLYYLGYCILLFLLPLTVVNFHQLLQLYLDWWDLLRNDSHSYGLSVIGAYAQFLPVGRYGVTIINLLGLIYVLGILVRVAKSNIIISKTLLYKVISLLMLWMVIFNHKAEPQTYILAYIGVAIWFFTNKENSILNDILIFIIFVVDLLSDTRLASHDVKIYLSSHAIEAIVCFPVWLTIGFDILKYVSNKAINTQQ